jgi:hypothetical protein
VKYGNGSYETKAQFPEWNFVRDSETSNYVGLRMAVTYFFAIEHNIALMSQITCGFNVKTVKDGEKYYENWAQFIEWDIVWGGETKLFSEWQFHASFPQRVI